jgi:hypothetical protein
MDSHPCRRLSRASLGLDLCLIDLDLREPEPISDADELDIVSFPAYGNLFTLADDVARVQENAKAVDESLSTVSCNGGPASTLRSWPRDSSCSSRIAFSIAR